MERFYPPRWGETYKTNPRFPKWRPFPISLGHGAVCQQGMHSYMPRKLKTGICDRFKSAKLLPRARSKRNKIEDFKNVVESNVVKKTRHGFQLLCTGINISFNSIVYELFKVLLYILHGNSPCLYFGLPELGKVTSWWWEQYSDFSMENSRSCGSRKRMLLVLSKKQVF